LTEDTKKKLPTLMELIDRYIPRHTREEVMQMSFVYEERIRAILLHLHEYHERCAGLQRHLGELEEEYAKETMIKVPYGRVTAELDFSPASYSDHYRVMWRPDPRQMVIAQRREPLDPQEYPRLFEAIMKQFEREFTTTVKDQIKAEYAKLYASTARTRI
jgi:hypothetical protein